MNKKFYQLCCTTLFGLFVLPAIGQDIADSVMIQDEWSPTKITDTTNELQVVQPVKKLQKIKSFNDTPERTKVEITVLGSNRYKRSSRYRTKRHFSGHLSGVYVGLTNYLEAGQIYGSDGEFMRLNWSSSRTILLNPFQANVSLSRRGNFGMVLGVGLEYQRLYFSDEQTTIEKGDKGVIIPLAINGEYDVRRSTLKHYYLTVPVSFEWQYRRLFISTGAIGAIRLHSRTKVVYDYDGSKRKQKNVDDFSMIPFKIDASVKIGYGDFALFCNYTLTRMFEKNKGINVYPLTIGIGFVW